MLTNIAYFGVGQTVVPRFLQPEDTRSITQPSILMKNLEESKLIATDSQDQILIMEQTI